MLEVELILSLPAKLTAKHKFDKTRLARQIHTLHSKWKPTKAQKTTETQQHMVKMLPWVREDEIAMKKWETTIQNSPSLEMFTVRSPKANDEELFQFLRWKHVSASHWLSQVNVNN